MVPSLPRVLACAGVVLLGSGCVDPYYQTRYIPSAEEIRWDAEHLALPWQPPALVEDGLPRARNGRPARPAFASQPIATEQAGVLGYHYEGSLIDPTRR